MRFAIGSTKVLKNALQTAINSVESTNRKALPCSVIDNEEKSAEHWDLPPQLTNSAEEVWGSL